MESFLPCQDEIEIVNYELLEALPIDPLSTNLHHQIEQVSGRAMLHENLVSTQQSFITVPTNNTLLNLNLDMIDTEFNTINIDVQNNPGIIRNGKLKIND